MDSPAHDFPLRCLPYQPPTDRTVPLDRLVQSSPDHPPGTDEVPAEQPRKSKHRPKPARKKRESRLEAALRKSAEVEVESKKQKLQHDRADHTQLVSLRWIMGVSGLAIVVWWQVRILALVEGQGSGRSSIPTPVLLAVVSSTTVNVFGLLLIVMKFVFPAADRPAGGKSPAPAAD